MGNKLSIGVTGLSGKTATSVLLRSLFSFRKKQQILIVYESDGHAQRIRDFAEVISKHGRNAFLVLAGEREKEQVEQRAASKLHSKDKLRKIAEDSSSNAAKIAAKATIRAAEIAAEAEMYSADKSHSARLKTALIAAITAIIISVVTAFTTIYGPYLGKGSVESGAGISTPVSMSDKARQVLEVIDEYIRRLAKAIQRLLGLNRSSIAA